MSTKGLSGKLAVCQAGEGYRWFIPRHLCQIRHEILFEETPIRFAIMELRLGRKCRASSASSVTSTRRYETRLRCSTISTGRFPFRSRFSAVDPGFRGRTKVPDARWNPGAAKAATVKFQSGFALSHVVAMRLKTFPSKHRRAMSAQRQKPIDFAAERLCLVLSANG